VLRLADAFIVSEVRHKTIAGIYRLLVDAPDPSHGADTLRISPWTAEDRRAPIRHFLLADLLAYAQQSDTWPLSVSLDDSLDEKDQGTRHLEAVAYHHDHPKSQGKKNPYSPNGAVHVEVRFALGTRSYAYDWRLSLREKTVRRLHRQRTPEQRRRLRKKTMRAQEMLAEVRQLWPPGCQVSVLFASWYAANRWLKCCRRPCWHVVGAIKSNRQLDDQQRSPWPQALRHQRSQRVQLTAPDQRQRTSLVRTRPGQRNTVPFEVCVLLSQRHHREKHPQDVLCTALALSAQPILRIYHKRWPIEVDNFSVKQPWGLADLRVQSYAATAKWFAMVFLAFVFLPWRLHHAHAKAQWHSLADVVRQHRYEHARTLLATACQEAAKLSDSLPVLERLLCQPA
jgi:hypothetical protein